MALQQPKRLQDFASSEPDLTALDEKDAVTISDSDFNRFKEQFNYWIGVFGLRHYRVTFRHRKIEDSYADIDVNEMGKIATVHLTKSVERPHEDGLDIDAHALHEVVHLATHRLFWLGQCRHVLAEDIQEECEALTRRIGNAIESLIASEREMAEQLAQMNARCASLDAELQMHRRKTENEYWCWRDDEQDDVESLTCPILIEPGQMWKILSENRDAKKKADESR